MENFRIGDMKGPQLEKWSVREMQWLLEMVDFGTKPMYVFFSLGGSVGCFKGIIFFRLRNP